MLIKSGKCSGLEISVGSLIEVVSPSGKVKSMEVVDFEQIEHWELVYAILCDCDESCCPISVLPDAIVEIRGHMDDYYAVKMNSLFEYLDNPEK